MASTNVLGDALGIASTTGIEAYEISQGANVSVNSVNGVGQVQVGQPTAGQFFSSLSGTTVLVLGLVVVGLFVVFGRK